MTDNKELLKNIAPFNSLPETVFSEVSEMMTLTHFNQGETVYEQDKSILETVDIIIKGRYAAYFYDSNNEVRLEELYAESDIYGGSSVLLNKKYSIRTVIAAEETEVLRLDKEEFKALCRSYNTFFQHFTVQFGNKMLNDEYAHFVQRDKIIEENYIDADVIFTRKIDSITPRLFVGCTPDTPLWTVASLMESKKVNCLFVVENETPIAMVSKDILVKHALAAQKDPNSPIIEVAQKEVICIQKDALVYEALLALFPSRQEYILVKDGDENLGYLSRYRLLTEHAQSPLIFIQSVKLSNTVLDLKEKWTKVPELISLMLGRGVHAEIVNRIVTTTADEILLRVIEVVQNEMGPPPAKFCFMVIGSEGRQEQTLATDQDNAIVYEDKANEHRELVRAYFLDFADRISTRLNDIGFKFCSGGFMAKNPKWCHSLSHWKSSYSLWVANEEEETVVQFSTFFDCRFVYGEKYLFDELQQHMLNCLDKSSSMFYSSLVSKALAYDIPLTLFNSLKTFSQDERKVFNIKRAMTPIVDLIRMYSLKHKITEVNTGMRMKRLVEEGHINEKKYRELRHAYYYLMGLRLKSQSADILVDFREATNYIEPKRLTQVEQATLREIFKYIKDVQAGAKMSFNRQI